ncbi:PilX N-terminal domain-containing pilus assembly protein [uncultured Microbulbifer sp.]|uniref:pilus assembly PilX family protein n=1 Tax=uncultured Microbulbifer sp. TaxID=348147 RepID=UPI002611BD42|nr:PilX N-terminal domain-containing pilus assembly protein [uncultured Microbulbifer sp.]
MRCLKKEQGAVLMVSLIILLVLTLIGISGARSVLMSERMTSASRDAKVALEVAESMARLGEKEIEGLVKISNFGSVNWQHNEGEGPEDIFSEDTWKDTNSTSKQVSMLDPAGNKISGRMYIERFGLAAGESNVDDVDLSSGSTGGDDTTVYVFKIVSRGVSVSGTERIIVTLYGKEF